MFTVDEYKQWLRSHYWIPSVATVVYLAMIVIGVDLMKNRPPFKVKWILFTWNVILAIFSFATAWKSIQDALFMIQKFNLDSSICRAIEKPVRGFWGVLFVFSKFIEFGDTVFLIIRKRKIIFLHWFHHVTVLWISWILCTTGSSLGRYSIAMNSFVHVFMYSYFAISTLSIQLPRTVAMFITTIQILQMIGGMWIVLYSHIRLKNKHHCDVDPSVIKYTLLLYASYFILFLKYFYDAYVRDTKNYNSQTPAVSSTIKGKKE